MRWRNLDRAPAKIHVHDLSVANYGEAAMGQKWVFEELPAEVGIAAVGGWTATTVLPSMDLRRVVAIVMSSTVSDWMLD